MKTLSTNYMGIELKNPIVIGASNLVTNLDNIKRLEDAGAAAIVYKSLFEEQIQWERFEFEEELGHYNERHAEMTSLFPNLKHAGTEEFLMNLSKAKKALNIPLIASLNAVDSGTWIEFAKQIEQTGVDGIELNLYHVPQSFDLTGEDIITEQLNIVKEILKQIHIPLSVKLTPYYTNILPFIKELDKAGVQAFVLFNRLFQPDIDIESMEHFFPYNLSNENDNRLSLRYAGLLYGNIKANISSSNGIYNGADAIKMILAGADTVQVVSTIYKNNFKQITRIIKDIEDWMQIKSYSSLKDFKGMLSATNKKDPFAYKRAQYIDILMKSENIFNKYPLL